jgi:hypothetical protein
MATQHVRDLGLTNPENLSRLGLGQLPSPNLAADERHEARLELSLFGVGEPEILEHVAAGLPAKQGRDGDDRRGRSGRAA